MYKKCKYFCKETTIKSYCTIQNPILNPYYLLEIFPHDSKIKSNDWRKIYFAKTCVNEIHLAVSFQPLAVSIAASNKDSWRFPFVSIRPSVSCFYAYAAVANVFTLSVNEHLSRWADFSRYTRGKSVFILHPCIFAFKLHETFIYSGSRKVTKIFISIYIHTTSSS